MRRTDEFFGTPVSSQFTSGALHFPVLARYQLFNFLSPGIGLYYSRIVTSWTVSAPSVQSTTVDYGRNDFGVVAGLGVDIPVSESILVIGDVRYSRSLTDAARASNEVLKFSDLRVLAGVAVKL